MNESRRQRDLNMGGSNENLSSIDMDDSDSSFSLHPSSLAICLVSGGMDSCVTAAIANQENDALAFLHVSYGQRTERRELKAFNDIGDHYKIRKRLNPSIEYLKEIGGSSLTDDKIRVADANLASREIPTSYVPFRNSHLLAIATSWAEVIGASRIYIGAVAEDSSGYPDCRPEFYEAFQKTIDVGTKPETNVAIVTPIINLRKSQIIKRGQELKAPLGLTWSCYQSEDVACGRCDSCALRLRGFADAGVADPIAYA
jgi:7-cyano-7-deazaguanine synthase